MKFAISLLTIALAYSAFAEPFPKEKCALADYQNVFNGISAQVVTVSDVVADYVEGTATGDGLQDASDELVTVINAGATSISGFAALNTLDALALVSPIQTLSGDVSDLVDAVIAAKPTVDAYGRIADVLASLQAPKAASEAVRDAITPKVPAAVQDIAAELAEGIVTDIERGIAAYD